MDRKPRLSIKTSASKTTLLDRTLSCATTPTDSTDSDQFDTVASPSSDTASSTRSSTTPNPRHSFESRSAHTTRSPRTNMTAYSKRVSSTQCIPQSNKNALIETGIGIGIRDAEVGGMLEGVQSGSLAEPRADRWRARSEAVDRERRGNDPWKTIPILLSHR
ncbi:hypothetical protein QFC24_004864 [Naganishia onofrii]|uniref:Uncharacterized protein n=1 Tax=Naganishia onofrii TaxID=1851511 RepID=A0ACC2XC39_9TREE|nr:hypothetical protein QFC24_004864 [Naganishia onofrii]